MTDLVAVFVDGDNVAATHAGKIIRWARQKGTVSLAKVYGGENALANWQEAVSYQFVYSGSGKNATDVLMAIEATEHILSNPVQTVMLCSSDADFTHVARFIRYRGVHVIGIGEEKSKPELRHACSEFRLLNCDAPTTAPKKTHMSELDKKIVAVITQHGEKKSRIRVADLNPLIRSQHGTIISQHPEKNWRTYFANRSELYDLDPRGPDAMVRIKPSALA